MAKLGGLILPILGFGTHGRSKLAFGRFDRTQSCGRKIQGLLTTMQWALTMVYSRSKGGDSELLLVFCYAQFRASVRQCVVWHFFLLEGHFASLTQIADRICFCVVLLRQTCFTIGLMYHFPQRCFAKCAKRTAIHIALVSHAFHLNELRQFVLALPADLICAF